MRELKPDLAHALSPGGPALAGPDGVAEVLPLWRGASSQRVRDLAWCSLAPPLLSRLPMPDVGGAGAAASAAAGPASVAASAAADSAASAAAAAAATAAFAGSAAEVANHGAVPAFQLARWPAAPREAWVRWLAAAAPETLPETLAELGADAGARAGNRSLRLGRHAERLLHFALSHAFGLELLAANVPVRQRHDHGIRTLGELDFVWRDPAKGEVVHWEMATKFYLHVDSAARAGMVEAPVADLRAFVGPNLVDRLGDKLDHIVRRQLPLGRTPEALAALGRGIDRGEVYLLGWLFYRNGMTPPGLDALGIAPDHLRGWWSTIEDWSTRASTRPGSRWCRLPRADWLSGLRLGIAPAEGEPVLEDVGALHAALAERFADAHPDHTWRRESPVMLCELVPLGARRQDGWIEVSRGFVVPDGWEARARERVARP